MKLWLAIVTFLLVIPTQAIWLEWDRNFEPNVVGYRVYLGTTSRSYDKVFDVGNSFITFVPFVPGATNYYALTAYSREGIESAFSDEVTYFCDCTNPPPSPPIVLGFNTNFPSLHLRLSLESIGVLDGGVWREEPAVLNVVVRADEPARFYRSKMTLSR